MSVHQVFDEIPVELREKVVKKINKVHRWVQHGGGWSEIWFYTFAVIVMKMYEDMGYEVSIRDGRRIITLD